MNHINTAKKEPRDTLLFGWRTESDRREIGFDTGQRRKRKTRELIELGGESHAVSVGPTGCGKGRGVCIPNLLTYPGPVVCLDVKGENYEITARQRRRMGHQVIKLDPYGVLDDGPSDCLNPMDTLDLPGAKLPSECQMLAELISFEEGGLQDLFWDANGKGLHSGAIAAIASLRTGAGRNLMNAIRLLTSKSVPYELAAILDKPGEKLDPLAIRELSAFLAMPENTRGGVLATAQSYIKTLITAEVEETLSESTFKLCEFAAGKPIDIFIVIPPEMMKPARGLLRLWVGVLMRALLSRRTLPEHRTLFLLDEAATLGHLSLLEDIMTIGRGYGIRCHTLWQDLNQLKQNYPRSWQTILNNCGVIQVFGFANRSMATAWSEYLRHSPEELQELRPNEQILLIQRQGEIRCRRLDYLRDPMFQSLYDTSRFYAAKSSEPEGRADSPGEL